MYLRFFACDANCFPKTRSRRLHRKGSATNRQACTPVRRPASQIRARPLATSSKARCRGTLPRVPPVRQLQWLVQSHSTAAPWRGGGCSRARCGANWVLSFESCSLAVSACRPRRPASLPVRPPRCAPGANACAEPSSSRGWGRDAGPAKDTLPGRADRVGAVVGLSSMRCSSPLHRARRRPQHTQAGDDEAAPAVSSPDRTTAQAASESTRALVAMSTAVTATSTHGCCGWASSWATASAPPCALR
mmetsp:Transcript_25923/g.97663  ORF Transcript_25923/g.97663 Transcript_25923/m.97663 type:complete len:247 (-) Transcript_25923:1642-2382(-)